MTCILDNCERPIKYKARRLCNTHYQRWAKTGAFDRPCDRRPVVVGEVAHVPLTQGRIAIIDASDLALVSGSLWSLLDCKSGLYANRSASSGEPCLMHRLITGAPAGFVVDHRNGDGLDNRRANLRVGVTLDNSRNLTLRTTSQSGYIGVGWRPDKNRWRAYVGIEGRLHHVGHFHTAEAAARARDDYVREHAPSEFWSYNFPRPGEQGIRRNERESA